MVVLKPIEPGHRQQFLDAVLRSTSLHRPWVSPPASEREFDNYLRKYQTSANISMLAFTQDGELIACININEIVRGVFQSAYLGYYAFRPLAGKGMMYLAMQELLSLAFGKLGLHRLEANIQPLNTRSIKLVQRLGFRLEGFSPRYLRIGHEWKDHERYAITIEDLLSPSTSQ